MQGPFEQLIIALDEDDASATKLPAESTPFIPPEIWSRIFVMAFGNMKQLSRISRLCKSVYYYCWLSPAAKANFYFECYGKRQAIFMAFATKCFKVPQFKDILNLMIQNGAKYSCLDKGQACPLLILSKMSNSVELIKLFYSCQPHISKEHLKYAITNAAKLGRLDSICALLHQDPFSTSPSVITSLLEENAVRLDMNQLMKAGHTELVLFLVSARKGEFSPLTVAFAISKNHLTVASEMIETRISTYERGSMLNDMDSGNILNALGYKDVSRIKAAFSLGIAPLANAMQISSGVILIHNYVTQFINLHNWEHLKETPRTLNPHAFQLMDVFLNAGALFNQRTIINAAGSGNKDYIAHVLQKWTQRRHYISVCLISPTAIHNAFMWRDWELVEMLLESCKRWWKLNGTTFHSLEDVTLALSDGEMIEHDLSTYVPFPMKPNDTYYFEKVPFLVKLGVYPEYVHTKALEELAYYSLDWDQDLAIACAEDLIKAGAEVTHQAIYNASVSENHDWNLTTPRLKYLLDKYEVRPGDEFLSFMDFAAAAQREGVSETVHLILAKGVPVTMDVLLFVFRNEFVSTPSDGTRAIFAAINSNNFLLRNFLDQLEANLEVDIQQEELPFYEELFTYLQSLGFRTTQNIVDCAEINNKPLLAGLFGIMIEE